MDLDIATKSILGMFFVYLVMFGSYINVLLNCGLQRFLLNNIYLRHIIVFFSIFIFTFVLNWYTPKSIVVTEGLDENESFLDKYSYVLSSFGYTGLIYIVFILSTKQEIFFMFSFLLILMAVIGIYVIYRVELSGLGIDYISLKDDFFLNKDKLARRLDKSKIDKGKFNEKTITLTSRLHNTVSAGYLLLIINIMCGFTLYFKRQWKEHAHHWNWVTFFLGGNKCKGT
tara:strand:- start:4304 stop:4987 length:684 start_codon:yes stop_codon:yes gene_type:complete